jgi:hypothetical protein
MACAGCGGPKGPETYVVTGTAMLDGKPLPTGDVIFYPEATNMPAVMGNLKDGKFVFRAVAGKHRVEIQATGGEPIIASPVDPPVYKSIVPARYNSQSTLTAEVQPTGRNHFDFALQSAPPGKK